MLNGNLMLNDVKFSGIDQSHHYVLMINCFWPKNPDHWVIPTSHPPFTGQPRLPKLLRNIQILV